MSLFVILYVSNNKKGRETMSVFRTETDGKYEELVKEQCGRIIKSHEGSLMMVEVIFDNYHVSEAHRHVHEQMTYCLEGEFDFYVEGKTEHIKAGDTIYFPSDVEHNCKVTSGSGRLLDVFTPVRQDFLK